MAEHLHVDLCCGLGGWQVPFRESEAWRSVGLDVRRDLDPDVVADVRELPLSACEPTLVTASPPCTEFSRWDLPWMSDEEPDMGLVYSCLAAIDRLEPAWWVLENVRGLHRYHKPADKVTYPFYLWGTFPPFDVDASWKGKMQTSGERPEERARIPYPLADALRRSVEVWT